MLSRIQGRGEVMEFEAMCERMVGKRVRITFKDGGTPVIGKCIGYTRAVDNDPEIAEIDVDTGIQGAYCGLMESEIADVEELKN